MCAHSFSAFAALVLRVKRQVLPAGSRLCVDLPRAQQLPWSRCWRGWRVRAMPLGSVGRWMRARSCAERRVGEAHMPGCKHVRQRDPGCLNNVKY